MKYTCTLYIIIHVDGEKGELLNKEKRKDYIKEYRKTVKKYTIELKNDINQKLIKILEVKNMKITEYLRQKIENDYNEIK